MAKCRVCKVELSEKNASNTGIRKHLCRTCFNKKQRDYYARTTSAKIDYNKILKLNALGGLNIRILAHAKAGEPMYIVEEVGFEDTKTNYYEAWGDFVSGLRKILREVKK